MFPPDSGWGALGSWGAQERYSRGQPRVGEEKPAILLAHGGLASWSDPGERYMGQKGNFGWPRGVRIQGVAQARERSEWAKSKNMATTVLATGWSQAPFSSGKVALTFTAMSFGLDKRTAKSVMNFLG